jgi:hypothetical protein
VLADLDRLIAKIDCSSARESAPLLQMVKLDMHARIYDISEGELRALTSAVERTLLSRRAAAKAAKRGYPRRRCERSTEKATLG